MKDHLLSNLDKFLLELVFQCEQASTCKEQEKQQIQIYITNVIEGKQEIGIHHENINQLDEEIVRLQKQNEQNKEKCKTWKPTYVLFSEHEEHLQKELKSIQANNEKDKKAYQDQIIQCREILWKHQAQHSESSLAKEYFKKKASLDEIQTRVLKCTEEIKQKENIFMNLLEPAPFRSFHDWALQIVSLRKNTQNTYKKALCLLNESSQLEKESLELERNWLQKISFQKTEAVENRHSIYFQVPSKTRQQEQIQYRQFATQKQTNLQQWLPSVTTLLGKTETNIAALELMYLSKDSVYASETESFAKAHEDYLENCAEQNDQIFLPEPSEREEPIHEKELCSTPTFKMNHSIECEGSSGKSTPFSFLMASTPKTPDFNLFDSSVFGTVNTPNQLVVNYSSTNQDQANPQEETESTFDRAQGEEEFTFSFQTQRSPHPLRDKKDDFSFPFSFGQDPQMSQPSSFKGFQCSSQSAKQFTFF
ncbi:protein SIX6OS1 [Latimeria chalumnae]|uniref:Chromosome 14 open reading frame 39 n=1 Tax=Latimeria chalumnae TaxID=7897 RepID=M3XIB0_LATCH|nr:PREDICTED: protein SIX6OS1 [Latimeria chalumnae]XP_014340929.1 PREDICTED: protein SIX6OS1 [Latimeria chalumnae]|eukprot:XP_014340924.1 PREDICTED: protein SIX6OS1 [Latimeria chalumnae]